MQHRGIEYDGKIWKNASEASEALQNGIINEDDYHWIMEGLQTEEWKIELEGAFCLSNEVIMQMTEENIYLIWTTLDRVRAYEKRVDQFWELYKWIQSMPEMD